MTEQLDIELEAMRQINAQLLAKNSELIEALDRLWSYAATGASITDVNTYDQPEFVKARALLVEAGKWKR